MGSGVGGKICTSRIPTHVMHMINKHTYIAELGWLQTDKLLLAVFHLFSLSPALASCFFDIPFFNDDVSFMWQHANLKILPQILPFYFHINAFWNIVFIVASKPMFTVSRDS